VYFKHRCLTRKNPVSFLLYLTNLSAMNIISKLFEKTPGLYKKTPLRNEKFLNISLSDAQNYPNLLIDMFEGRTDGVIISSFLSPAEIDHFFKMYKDYPQEKQYDKAFGKVLGYVAHDSGEKMEGYTEKAAEFKKDVASLFGFDFYARFEKLVNKLSVNKPVVPAESPNHKPYLGFNIKFMNPNYGGLIEHVGLAFYNLFPSLKYLESQIDTSGQISYFTILQHPEEGGELVLFDLRFGKEGMKYTTFADEELLQMVRQKASYKVKPKPGDILLFNGGQIWHRIAEIKGNRDRVTIANFISLSKDHSKFFYWS
jgi:hypothetical protein